jgi:hypothetical protein
MGTTATSLHVLRPPRATTETLVPDVEHAYRKLGFSLQRKTRTAPARRVVLSGGHGDPYLSIYDSDNDQIDGGDLKELAVLLSKRLASAVVFTSVYDSDRYEFIVFYKGKQKDAAVSDPDDHTGGLRMLSGKQRAKEWSAMFGRPSETLASRAEPFAEWDLGRWCESAGLPAPRATTLVSDFDETRAPEHVTLLFGERKAAPRPVRGATNAEQTFGVVCDEDNDFVHRLFPAAWPVAPGETILNWFVETGGPGFTGLRIRPRLEASAGASIVKAQAAALPFFNGQLTMGNIAAKQQWGELAGGLIADAPETWEAPEFIVPPLDPESRRKFLILVSVTLDLPDNGHARAAPSIETMSLPSVALDLPPAAKAVTHPAWSPVGPSVEERVWHDCERSIAQWASRAGVSEERVRETIADAIVNEAWIPWTGPSVEPMSLRQHVAAVRHAEEEKTDELRRRVNWPAVALNVAILPDNAERERAQAQDLVEAWLASLHAEPGTQARIRTEKHATPSFSVAKTNWSVPLESVATDKRWAELFGVERDYRTIHVELIAPGFTYPQGGAILQGSDRHRYALLGSESGEVLNCSLWLIDEGSVQARFGISAEAQRAAFARWLVGVDAVQAWSTHAAWIPDLGSYKSQTTIRGTPYERLTLQNAMDRARFNTRSWTDRHLRFVTPTLWLGAALRSRIDARALEPVAVVGEHGSLMELTLKAGATLNALERALGPILPAQAETHGESSGA